DGGLLVTLLEMAFAGHCGLDVRLDQTASADNILDALFSEELGAVVQVADDRLERVLELADEHGLADILCHIGTPNADGMIRFTHGGQTVLENHRIHFHRLWAETSYQIQRLRDNSECAQEEYDGLLDGANPGLHAQLGFDPADDVAAP